MRRVWVVLAVVVALALSGCGDSQHHGTKNGESGARGGTLTLGTPYQPVSFDPQDASAAIQYLQAVYDPLIRRTADGKYVPMLATSWQYNQDKTVLTMQLRKGVTFSDGTPFNAEAAKANLIHFRDGTGTRAYFLKRLASVDVVDDYTIKLQLSEPEPSLIYYLSYMAGFMASPKALGTEAIKTHPVGSGPYTLDVGATTVGSVYVYNRKPDYWDPSLQYWNKIVLKPITDPTARVNALVSGQVDGATIDVKAIPQAKAAGLKETNVSRGANWGLILMDRGGKVDPALGDVRVRQAINYAIDVNALLKTVYQGRGQASDQIFGPDSTGYVPDLNNYYPYDPAKAKSLIQEAGYAGTTIKMPIIASTDPAVTAVLTQELAAVGLKLDVVQIPVADQAKELLGGKYSMYLWGTGSWDNSWEVINGTIAPTSLINPFHTTDPKVEQLIKEIQYGDDATAAAKAKELNTYIVQQAWYAPWFWLDTVFYSRPDKVTVDASPWEPSGVPWLWSYRPAAS